MNQSFYTILIFILYKKQLFVKFQNYYVIKNSQLFYTNAKYEQIL